MGWKAISLAVFGVACLGVTLWKEREIRAGVDEAVEFTAKHYTRIKDLLAKKEAEAFRQELIMRQFAV